MILTIIQARLGSTRLPGKILLPISGKTILQHVYDAALNPKLVAIPASDRLEISYHFGGAMAGYEGDDHDVLGRFYYAYQWACGAKTNPNIDWILRLTADCPMLTREIVDRFVPAAKGMCFLDDLCIYTNRPWDPDGYDMELFSVEALNMAHKYATDGYDREHCTAWLYRHLNVRRFSVFGREPQPENPQDKVSIDTLDDYHKVKAIMEGR